MALLDFSLRTLVRKTRRALPFFTKMKKINLYFFIMLTMILNQDASTAPTTPKVTVAETTYYPTTTASDLTESKGIDQPIVCGKGEYVAEVKQGKFQCVPCDEGTYQDEDGHTSQSCKPCKKLDEHIHLEIKVNCTPTTNAEFRCAQGYYSSERGTEKECKNCTECKFEKHEYLGRNCTNTTDTICCEHPNMIVEYGKSETLKEFVCVNLTTTSAKTTTTTTTTSTTTTTTPKYVPSCDGAVYRSDGCLAGEHLVPGCNTTAALCRPCPQGLYMNETHHRNVSCKTCPENPKDGKMFSSCNGTHNGTDIIEKPLSPGVSPLHVLPVVIAILFVLAFITWIIYKRMKRAGTGNTYCMKQMKKTIKKHVPPKSRTPRRPSLTLDYSSVPTAMDGDSSNLESDTEMSLFDRNKSY